jgi:drug/metabolite transporter (DMT)-like permease
MTKYKPVVYLFILLAVVFWGISYVWMTLVLEHYTPITTMFLRLSISGILLSIFLQLAGKTEKVKKEDYLHFAILSFFSPFCYFLGESYGLLLVTPTIAAVIIATIPVFTPLLGFLAFREKLSFLNITGFVVSFAGVIIMVLDFEFRFSASPKGVALLFFAVVSALINIIFLKKLAIKYSSGTIIKVQNILGALFFLPLFLLFDFDHFLNVQPTAELIGALLKLSVFASTLAFMFYTIGVREIGVAKTSVFSNLIPVMTAIFSYFILREYIDLNKILGIIIVITGLLLSQSAKWINKKTG